jgi:hypothetical protein
VINTPLFVAIHKWKKENLKTVAKKVIEAMGQTLEGANMCSSYLRADQTGAWCVWEAKSADQVKDFLKKWVPEMETEVVPVLQWYPPSPNLYTITHVLIS